MSAGRLLVVATPIGNLGDLSPRAAAALREAHVVLAEDTRRTRPLLDHAGGHGKLISCHQHNEEQRVPAVLERLGAGELVALVTDAGTPGVSDPGGRVVAAVVQAGFSVEVVPGPSALVAALMGAGLVSHRFGFLGFLPRKAGGRRALLSQCGPELALVLFEAPGRVEEVLAFLHQELGPRRVVVARELTKRFETFHRGHLGGELTPPFVEKGEVVLVIEAGEAGERAAAAPADEARVFEELRADAALTPRQRAKAAAKALGISPRDAYARFTDEAAPGDGVLGGRGAGAGAGAAPVAPSTYQERIAAAAHAGGEHRQELAECLAAASRAFLAADAAAALALGRPREFSDAAPGVASDIPGADALMAWLQGHASLPAPVEAAETATALLGAMSAADALEDALKALVGAEDED
jgi:16S rRNA (cytidine1402-2'-O)-methyltransferase